MTGNAPRVPPRLLVVHNERTLGGAELQLIEFLKTLKSYPVAVRCLVSQEEMRRRLDGYGDVTVARMGMPGGRARGWGMISILNPRQWKWWRDCLRTEHPDAILTLSVKEASILSQLSSTPVYWMVHSPVYRWTHRMAIRCNASHLRAAVILAAGYNVLSSLEVFDLDGQLLPLQLADSTTRRRFMAPGQKAPHLGYAGRLTPEKNVGFLVQVVKVLRDGGLPASLTVWGLGPERTFLERLVSRLSLEEAVTFEGWVDDISRALDATDIFCFASQDPGEARPMAMLTARSLGLPVVSLVVGDVLTLAAEDPDVRTVSTASPSAFATAVSGLWAEMRSDSWSPAPSPWVQRSRAPQALTPVAAALCRTLGIPEGSAP